MCSLFPWQHGISYLFNVYYISPSNIWRCCRSRSKDGIFDGKFITQRQSRDGQSAKYTYENAASNKHFSAKTVFVRSVQTNLNQNQSDAGKKTHSHPSIHFSSVCVRLFHIEEMEKVYIPDMESDDNDDVWSGRTYLNLF
jgi:hypothetical protein